MTYGKAMLYRTNLDPIEGYWRCLSIGLDVGAEAFEVLALL